MRKDETYSTVFGYSRQIPERCCRECCFYNNSSFSGREGYGSCRYHDFLLSCINRETWFDFDIEEVAFDERGYGICPHFCTRADMLDFKSKSYDEIVLDKSVRAGMGPEEKLFTEILDGKQSPDIKKATSKMMKYVKTILKNAEVLGVEFPSVMIQDDNITPTGHVMHFDLSNEFTKVRQFIAKYDKAAKELFSKKEHDYCSWKPKAYNGLTDYILRQNGIMTDSDTLKKLMDAGLFASPDEVNEELRKNFSYIIQ